MLLRDTIWPVDLRRPVDPTHRLNRGRRNWWLSLSGLDGGRTLYDLQGLANLTSSAPAWGGSARPGALGAAVSLSGSNDFTAQPVYLPNYFQPASFAAWCRPKAASVSSRCFNCDYAGVLSQDSTGTSLVFSFNDRTLGWLTLTSLQPFTLGGWYRLVGTLDGSVGTFYVNGVVQGTASYASGTGLNLASTTIQVGSLDSSAYYWQGQVDDVAIWDRALSASEVWEDYLLSRAGYPGVLHRLSPALWLMGTATPPVGPAPTRTLLGVGLGVRLLATAQLAKPLGRRDLARTFVAMLLGPRRTP